MTDRGQPGAQGSTLRNVEAGESSQTLSDGFIVPSNEPTLSSQRYADLDESQYAEFNASYSSTSLDVTIEAGEAFIKGWLARDTQTTITLDDFTDGQTVVLAWDADAVYDDSIHADREEADRVIITREADLPTTPVPYIPIWEFDTDGDGVIDAVDRRDVGSTADPRYLNTQDTVPLFFEDWGDVRIRDRVGQRQSLAYQSDNQMGTPITTIRRPEYPTGTSDGVEVDGDSGRYGGNQGAIETSSEIKYGVWRQHAHTDVNGGSLGFRNTKCYVLQQDADNWIRFDVSGSNDARVIESVGGTTTTLIGGTSTGPIAYLIIYPNGDLELHTGDSVVGSATPSQIPEPNTVRLDTNESNIYFEEVEARRIGGFGL